jgi:hypothetical protein
MEIINVLKKINWNIVLNYIHATKNQLVQPSERFLASEIRDNLIPKISNKTIDYINENGNDLLFTDDNKSYKIECKYLSDGYLYTKNKNKRNFAPKITLVNTISKETPTELPQDYSESILCLEPYAISLVSTKDLINNKLIKFEKGQIVAKQIPVKLFHKIFDYNQSKQLVEKFDIESESKKFVQDSLDKFLNVYNQAYYNSIQEIIDSNVLTPIQKIELFSQYSTQKQIS